MKLVSITDIVGTIAFNADKIVSCRYVKGGTEFYVKLNVRGIIHFIFSTPEECKEAFDDMKLQCNTR